FAAVSPVPLRAEPIFAALREALATRGRAGNRGRSVPQILERRFAELFDHDPSAPIDEIAPSIPQALFLMNSPVLEGLIDARRGMLRPILARHRSDRGAIEDVWLRVLARPPREDEVAIALRHLREAPSGRGEAFEDLVWSLLNSYELRNRD
ncbi:MAG TPA: hypothetical protein VK116_09165, partial [Planctomycetota bacterium]|nr:hypothetical protein [Planctomycetota bacterium]